MTHPDPQAAPPATDLRAMSDEDLLTALAVSAQPFQTQDVISRRKPIRAELLRRLARPDAMREKVMRSIESISIDQLQGSYEEGRNKNNARLHWDGLKSVKATVKAAVAAVLEETS